MVPCYVGNRETCPSDHMHSETTLGSSLKPGGITTAGPERHMLCLLESCATNLHRHYTDSGRLYFLYCRDAECVILTMQHIIQHARIGPIVPYRLIKPDSTPLLTNFCSKTTFSWPRYGCWIQVPGTVLQGRGQTTFKTLNIN